MQELIAHWIPAAPLPPTAAFARHHPPAPPLIYDRRFFVATACSLIASSQFGAPSAHAAASDVLREEYDGYAPTYDALDGGGAARALGFPQLRAELLAKASGDVLEVGVGTGLNLPLYRRQQLASLTAVDLSDGMLAQARRAAAAAGLPVQLRRADVAALPFEDGSFDCVVDTFSLCVFPDPVAALREMARVVRPSGRVLLVEHARSAAPLLGWYQDVTAGAVAATGKACVWNQDVPALLRAAGLRPVSMEPHLGGLLVSIEAAKALPAI
jgi:ubiquinone/menaquinone biosynthesis C-methylase UbiE